mmetsp:Transcript_109278/g.348813  ORF Transcript_109278/g.348813 Transcript_109278/m.348813 type:complete len:289 (-) Transcript_109278:25-891(-)
MNGDVFGIGGKCLVGREFMVSFSIPSFKFHGGGTHAKPDSALPGPTSDEHAISASGHSLSTVPSTSLPRAASPLSPHTEELLLPTAPAQAPTPAPSPAAMPATHLGELPHRAPDDGGAATTPAVALTTTRVTRLSSSALCCCRLWISERLAAMTHSGTAGSSHTDNSSPISKKFTFRRASWCTTRTSSTMDVPTSAVKQGGTSLALQKWPSGAISRTPSSVVVAPKLCHSPGCCVKAISCVWHICLGAACPMVACPIPQLCAHPSSRSEEGRKQHATRHTHAIVAETP